MTDVEQARIQMCADIAAHLRICSLLAEGVGNICRARAFDTAAEIAETAHEMQQINAPLPGDNDDTA